MMAISAEVHFAQQLASNQTKICEKALKKVGRWLELKSASNNAFTEESMLKLWKGLFYYFWNCDKPLFQEERADVIAKYIHVFKNVEYSILFIDTFFQTMAREWSLIDRYRVEKFMMLVRRFLNQSFELLKRLSWKLKWIKKFRKIMKKTVISPLPYYAPLGLKIHISDIYMEELAKVGSEELMPRMTQSFLIPYCNILYQYEDTSFLSSVKKEVFLYLINQDTDSEKFVEVPILKFDTNSVQKLLLKFANKSHIKKHNMKVIYDIVKQFEDYKNGISYTDKLFAYTSRTKRLRKHDIEQATMKLMKEEEKESEEIKLYKKTKRKSNIIDP